MLKVKGLFNDYPYNYVSNFPATLDETRSTSNDVMSVKSITGISNV